MCYKKSAKYNRRQHKKGRGSYDTGSKDFTEEINLIRNRITKSTEQWITVNFFNYLEVIKGLHHRQELPGLKVRRGGYDHLKSVGSTSAPRESIGWRVLGYQKNINKVWRRLKEVDKGGTH